MGEVLRAYDTEQERLVALKRLTDHLTEDAQFRTGDVITQIASAHSTPRTPPGWCTATSSRATSSSPQGRQAATSPTSSTSASPGPRETVRT
jgi:hypothetical protein